MTQLIYIVGGYGVGKSLLGKAMVADFERRGNSAFQIIEAAVEAPKRADIQHIRELGIRQPYGKERQSFDVVIAEYVDLPEDADVRAGDLIIRMERAK